MYEMATAAFMTAVAQKRVFYFGTFCASENIKTKNMFRKSHGMKSFLLKQSYLHKKKTARFSSVRPS